MRRTLPSLRALESFEAVARYGNVTRAAEELGRTQSAVSRQIANLESFLRRKLFVRERKQIRLNEAGRRYYEKIAPVFDELEAETAKLVAFGGDDRVLRLGVSPTFASRWLMPRLAGFARVGGFAELHLARGLGRLDFESGKIDAAIEICCSGPTDAIAHHLLDEYIVPVISPELYKRNRSGPFDQLRLPSRCDTWRNWIEQCGPLPFTRFSLKFEDYSLMIEAACLGFGVAVLPTIYLNHEWSAGRLIGPFGKPVPSGRSYWLTYPESSRTKPKLIEFTNWLLAHREEVAHAAPPVEEIRRPRVEPALSASSSPAARLG